MRHLTWARRLSLGAAATAALCSFSSGVAQASACGATWTGAGGTGLWSTASNWSPADVPGMPINNNVPYQPDVCIPAGSSTVLLNYETTVDSISVGTGSTLEIWGQQAYTHGGLSLNNQDNGSGIASGAHVVLGTYDSSPLNETHGGINVLAGTLDNNGSIVSANTGDETPNFITGNFDNAGTLTVNNALQSTAGTWTLGGTVTVASGQTMTVSGPSSGSGSVNLTGTVNDSGSLSFGDAVNVAATSGTDSGNPIVVSNGVLSPSGSGSGTFHVMSGGAQLGSNIASGYTVWASGIPGLTHGDLTPTGSYTNSGTLELGSLDGTHGTLTVPSGDTFTNNGSLIFENTANGPDGLNGALINNASVSVQNQFTGAGAITNNGTFELTAASGNNSAASFTQGAGGTLKIDVTGGTSAVVPQLSLSSTAATAGTLVVDTSGGTATGTFPVIIASQQSGAFGTGFSGESYAVTYHDGTVSLTGPGSGSSGGGGSAGGGSSAVATTASAGGASTTGDSATLPVTCTGASTATCTITVSLSVTETVKGGKITAVAAKGKAKPKAVRRTVTIGSANVTLAAGHTQTITVSLNGTGRSLLKQHHKLAVALSASLGTSVISNQTLTFKQPAKKKPTKKHA